jgi:superfamily II DNA or RNA helicase
MADYSYQTHSAKTIFNNLLDESVDAVVLAATPGSGKTTISHICINKYLEEFPSAKILVLTHGQNLLKNQYIESLEDANVPIDFTFGLFSDDTQVRVGLPQAIHNMDWEEIDLLIVDECHEFYLRPMVQGIVKKLKPKHQILLTGSPSEFNRLKKSGKNYFITYISAEDLFGNDVFSPVDLNVVPVKYRRNARKSISDMIIEAKVKGYDLSKIMVAVRNISEARNVADYLKSIGRKVALSTYKNDRNNVVVKMFKNNDYDTLVVVQRGILGFSDNYITGMFDLRCSESVDISNQLFARVLRKHPENIRKFYFRCGEKRSGDFNDQVIMLHKIKAMMKKKIFEQYDGTNMTVKVA